ncbi:MAG: DUF4347 domain-containing protein, partial [Rhodobacteraceae bacterium]|nr:DUF4347 domain-containing protein [Paracoccaceae bacterium]
MTMSKRARSRSPLQCGFAANPIVAALRRIISAKVFFLSTGARRRGDVAASPTLRFEGLEPRLLLSADLSPFPSQLSPSDSSAHLALLADTGPRIDLGGGASSLVSMTVADVEPVALSSDEIFPETTRVPPKAPERDWRLTVAGHAASHVIVFVDGGLRDYQTLVAAIAAGEEGSVALGSPNTEVFVIDPAHNGLQQITDALYGKTGISAIHIFSHGLDGTLEFGADRIDAAGLDAHSAQLATWSSALTPDGDIMLYGCDVGFGQQGDRFLARMAELTGADVAASIDASGNPQLGGNWQLEKSTGAIEAGLPASEFSLNGFQSLLGSRTWDGGGDGVSWSDRFNWSGDLTPGANDDVVIDAALGDPAISISAVAGSVQVKSLTSSRPISVLSGATVQASSTIVLNRSMTLAGGTIEGGTVSVAGGAKLVATNAGGTLKDVTL